MSSYHKDTPGHETSHLNTMPVVMVRDLTRVYRPGQTEVHALRGVSLDVYPGEFIAVTGPSGSGKSTLMNIIGCMDRPTGGNYWLTGMLVSQLRSEQLALVRSQHIGFIFQSFNLLPRESALANVMLPLLYQGLPAHTQRIYAARALRTVGLADRLHHLPAQLSGGQQQRVAIARAIVSRPLLLLADEPTGNLDSETSQEILALLQTLNEEGITIIVVTHSTEVAEASRRRVAFRDGHIVRDEYQDPSFPRSLASSSTIRNSAGSAQQEIESKEQDA